MQLFLNPELFISTRSRAGRTSCACMIHVLFQNGILHASHKHVCDYSVRNTSTLLNPRFIHFPPGVVWGGLLARA